MNQHNDRYKNSLNDLDGFLGGYDTSSDGKSSGYNYGSTYIYGSSSNKYDYNKNTSNPDSKQSFMNSNNIIDDFTFHQTISSDNLNQPDSQEYVPLLNGNFSSDRPLNSSQSLTGSHIGETGNINLSSDSDSSKRSRKMEGFLSVFIVILPALLFLLPTTYFFGPSVNSFFHYLDLKNNGDTVTAYVKTPVSSKESEITYNYKGKDYDGKVNANYKSGYEVKIYVNPDKPSDIVLDGSVNSLIPATMTYFFILLLVSVATIANIIKIRSGNWHFRLNTHGHVSISTK